jgi:hypothetical protein
MARSPLRADQSTPGPHGASACQACLTAEEKAGTLAPEGPSMPKSSRMSLLSEVWAFMRVRKKWWLGPIMLVLLLFGALIVLTQGSAVAPFIYTIF